MEAVSVAPVISSNRQDGWIYRKGWDLSMIIFSAVLVPVPFLFAWGTQASGLLTAEQSIDIVNLLVAGLVGGPHLFSTFTYTFLDKTFVRKHPVTTWLALLIPAGVIYLGIYHFATLILIFFTWASIHIFHQLIYISDCYRERTGHKEPWWSRWTDYAVISLGLYPIGFHKLEAGTFAVGGVKLNMPAFAQGMYLPQLVTVVFFSLLLIWILKSVHEARTGRFCAPKTLLIGITAVVSFLLPLGSNLDILFQGYNTWHSFQYLVLFWLINRIRLERGQIDNKIVRKLCAGKSMWPMYYITFFVMGGIVMGITLLVRLLTTLGPDESYFIVILCILLMHYYFDHFLFTRTDFVT